MHRYVALTALTLFLIAGPLAAQLVQSLSETRFSVEFPSKPNSKNSGSSGSGDKKSGVTTTYRGKAGDLRYELAYKDYTPAELKETPLPERVKNERELQVRSANTGKSKIVENKEWPVTGGGPGWSLTIEQADGRMTRYAWVVQDGRAYQLQASGPKAAMQAASTTTFFSSFRLKK